jgi:hypothetical protein
MRLFYSTAQIASVLRANCKDVVSINFSGNGITSLSCFRTLAKNCPVRSGSANAHVTHFSVAC